jgi:hypothetical protein
MIMLQTTWTHSYSLRAQCAQDVQLAADLYDDDGTSSGVRTPDRVISNSGGVVNASEARRLSAPFVAIAKPYYQDPYGGPLIGSGTSMA